MGWEEDLFVRLDDLEAHAAAEFASAREPELADRSRTEYRQVTLAARLMASLEGEVSLEVVGVGNVRGRLRRVCSDWCLVVGEAQVAPDWVIPLRALAGVAGASERAVPELAWSPLSRLSLGSALRRVADSGQACCVHRTDGGRLTGTLRRIGADFVELVDAADRVVLVAFVAIAAVRSDEAG